MRKVVFACVHNAGRSQMAAAWLNHLADKSQVYAISAGTQPGKGVHPEVLVAMGEVGLDLSTAKPQLLTAELLQEATHLVTMGCGEECPVAPPKVQRLDWPLEDPKGKSIDTVRAIREDIRLRVAALLEQIEG